jgi:hypothetical protein
LTPDGPKSPIPVSQQLAFYVRFRDAGRYAEMTGIGAIQTFAELPANSGKPLIAEFKLVHDLVAAGRGRLFETQGSAKDTN